MSRDPEDPPRSSPTTPTVPEPPPRLFHPTRAEGSNRRTKGTPQTRFRGVGQEGREPPRPRDLYRRKDVQSELCRNYSPDRDSGDNSLFVGLSGQCH